MERQQGFTVYLREFQTIGIWGILLSGGVCNYGGVGCRKSMIVYKVNCLHPGCGQFYIGQTSQHLKKRMSQHFQETRRSVMLGEKSDTFASHFSQHLIQDENDPSPKNQRQYMQFEVIKEMDAISAMKSFGQLDCRLCMAERLKILGVVKNGDKIINSRSEIYGGCRHKKRFHSFFYLTILMNLNWRKKRVLYKKYAKIFQLFEKIN